MGFTGGSFGVSLFGAVFASRLQDTLAARAPGLHVNSSGGQFDPRVILRMPLAVRDDVLYAIAHAIQAVFFWAAPFAALLFVLGWFIKEVPLRGRAPAAAPPQERAPELTR